MEELKKLYPFKFLPIGEKSDWGGTELSERFGKKFVITDDKGNDKLLSPETFVAESHEIADLGYRDSQVKDGWLAGNTLSEIMDMYVDRVVGEVVFEYFGRQFPVSVKMIDANGRTPLMVHPDDEIAGNRYDFLGKAKMWYVLDARPESKLYLGFEEDTTVTDFYEKCSTSSPEGLLHSISPKKGECYMIEPGTVNAASDGVLLLEISQASPMDFCLSHWGDTFEDDDSGFGLVDALDFINYSKSRVMPLKPVRIEGQSSRIISRNEFNINIINLKDPIHIFADQMGSFSIYTCVEGEASVQIPEEKGMESYIISCGETILVPAEVEDYYVAPRQSGTVLIETILEKHVDTDLYIDPSVESSLEGEEEDDNSITSILSEQ